MSSLMFLYNYEPSPRNSSICISETELSTCHLFGVTTGNSRIFHCYNGTNAVQVIIDTWNCTYTPLIGEYINPDQKFILDSMNLSARRVGMLDLYPHKMEISSMSLETEFMSIQYFSQWGPCLDVDNIFSLQVKCRKTSRSERQLMTTASTGTELHIALTGNYTLINSLIESLWLGTSTEATIRITASAPPVYNIVIKSNDPVVDMLILRKSLTLIVDKVQVLVPPSTSSSTLIPPFRRKRAWHVKDMHWLWRMELIPPRPRQDLCVPNLRSTCRPSAGRSPQ